MKLQVFSGLILGLAVMGAQAHVKVQDFGDKTVYEFAIDRLDINAVDVDGEMYNQAKLVGVAGFEAVQYQPGAAELPVIRFSVLADSENDIVVNSMIQKDAEHVLVPNAKPVFESAAKIPGARHILRKNNAKLDTSAYSIEKVGSVRGQNKFLVTLRPATYSADLKAFTLKRAFSVEVKPAAKVNEAMMGLLFVVGEQFKNSASLAGYVALKKAQGFDVGMLDAGQLSAEEIRQQIRAYYQAHSSLKYVVIIGDEEDVPAQDATVISGVTDHFYACVDTDNYVSDLQTPDLQVGRFSVTSEQELATVVKKYTRYVKGDFRSMDWLNHAAFLATDDRYTVAEGTHNYAIDTYTRAKGYTGSFPKPNQAGGDKLYAITNHATTQNVMTAVSQGRSIVNYSGHGATTYWAGPQVTQEDVRALKDTGLPFVISNACITGDFRYDESFAETWQRTEWGAVMFWGSMDSTYWDEDDILERRMFDAIYRDGKLVFGDLTEQAMSQLATFYGGQGRSAYYWETYHLFGDPSLTLRLR